MLKSLSLETGIKNSEPSPKSADFDLPWVERIQRMYIIWKRRRITKTTAGSPARYRPGTHCPHATTEERYALTPHVVRSYRVDGKPRQKTVLILPAIRTCCVNAPEIQARWWHYVDDRIDWLGHASNTDSPYFVTVHPLFSKIRNLNPSLRSGSCVFLLEHLSARLDTAYHWLAD